MSAAALFWKRSAIHPKSPRPSGQPARSTQTLNRRLEGRTGNYGNDLYRPGTRHLGVKIAPRVHRNWYFNCWTPGCSMRTCPRPKYKIWCVGPTDQLTTIAKAAEIGNVVVSSALLPATSLAGGREYGDDMHGRNSDDQEAETTEAYW